jgi:uncharacterized protein
MIVYLDTSSLVKLYVEEEGSSRIVELVGSAAVVATSLVAYAEARSAFARRFREKAFSRGQYKKIVAGLDGDWERFMAVSLTIELVRTAGSLAEKHALRGFDAIHLASAAVLKKEISGPVLFSCADRRLQRASKSEGLDQP